MKEMSLLTVSREAGADAAMVYHALIQMKQEDDCARTQVSSISKLTGIEQITVMKMLTRLERAKYISIEPGVEVGNTFRLL